jgi:membrane-associated phospholipid phosphatase
MLYIAFVAIFLILWGASYAAVPALQRATAISARLFARQTARISRYRPYIPIVLTLIIGGVVIGWAGDQFIDLAELVRTKSPKLLDLDTVAHAWAVSKRTASDTSFFTLMSNIGSPVGMTAIATIVAIVLAIRKRFRWMLYLVITAGGGALLNMELKRYFARARPDIAEMLRRASGYSFPSGHAMGSTVVLLAMSYLAFRTATSWRWKAACLALAWTLILGISLSRVYLGVHWISDVAAGICIGALWVGLTTVGYETVRRIRLLRGARVSGS